MESSSGIHYKSDIIKRGFLNVADQLPIVGDHFAALSELPPAFVVSTIVAIVVSLLDHPGQALLINSKKPWETEIENA